MKGRFILVTVTLITLALCVACVASADEKDATKTPAAEATATANGSAAPVDCGAEVRNLGRDRNLTSRNCLLQAYTDGRAATWTSTMPTVEGDPIEFRVSFSRPTAIDVRIDNTKDRFAAPADRVVKTVRCTGLAVDPVALPPTFLLSGCDDRTGGEIRL